MRILPRAIYDSITLPNYPPPLNNVQLKMFYPFDYEDTSVDPTSTQFINFTPICDSRNDGTESSAISGSGGGGSASVSARDTVAISDSNKDDKDICSKQSPLPIVIFLNGFNCEASSYQWLVELLTVQRYVVVTYNWLVETFPGTGQLCIHPGTDFTALRSDCYGSKPTNFILGPILEKLQQINNTKVDEGDSRMQSGSRILWRRLDCSRVVLAGHSAGGRCALECASSSFFANNDSYTRDKQDIFMPRIVASFAYGAHVMGSPMSGFPPNFVCPLPDHAPVLILGGSADGVIAANSRSYGLEPNDAVGPLIQTFERALPSTSRHPAYLLIIQGANHYSITHPLDISTINFQDCEAPSSQVSQAIRQLISKVVINFLDAHVKHNQTALNDMHAFQDQQLDHELVYLARKR